MKKKPGLLHCNSFDFIPLLKSFFVNVLKCKVDYLNAYHYYVFLSDESLLT